MCAFWVSSDVAVQAFVSPRPRAAPCDSHSMAGFLDDVGNFFDGLGKKDDGKSGQSEMVEEVEGVYTGSTRIITIPGELLNGGFVTVAGP